MTSTMSATGMYDFVKLRESSARTYADSLPMVLSRGSGTMVEDASGRQYLDFLSCAGTLALGHNHPVVQAEVRRFLDSGGVQQALDLTTPEKYKFVKSLYDFMPDSFAGHAKIQFCGPSGADATEAAVKLFKTATGRQSVLAFQGGYHGMTAGALSLTGNLSAKRRVHGLMPDVHFLPYPYSYRCPFGIGGELGELTGLRYIERMLTDPEGGITTPAAIIVEAVQGEGGVIPAPVAWLRGLRDLTRELDIPLVIDEIQTGFGRTGQRFAYESAGIEPDAVLLSKAIGGGFPLSVVMYDERYDQWGPGAHAGTFRGNQIAMAAGAATLGVIESEGLVEQANVKGAQLEGLLTSLAASHDEVGDVRGRGLMWGIEVVDPTASADSIGSRPADGARARAIKARCLEHGLIVETGGRYGAVLRLLPPLTVSSDEIAQMAVALDKAFVDCS